MCYRHHHIKIQPLNPKFMNNITIREIRDNEEDYPTLMKLDSYTPESIALHFNNCITHADIEGLAALMTEDHMFVDMANNRIKEKENNIAQAWQPFFRLYPGYRNIFEKVIVRGSTVIMQGYSVCSAEILNQVRAIWVAEIVNHKVSLWHIYPDTQENRERLGL